MPSLLDDAERFHPIKPTAQFAGSDVPGSGSIIMSRDWPDMMMRQPGEGPRVIPRLQAT